MELSRTGVIAFHKFFLAILLCKLLELSLDVAYYETYSQTGYALLSVRIVLDIVKVLSEILLMMVILSISMGWWIAGRQPGLRERQIFWGSALSLFLLLIFPSQERLLYILCLLCYMNSAKTR